MDNLISGVVVVSQRWKGRCKHLLARGVPAATSETDGAPRPCRWQLPAEIKPTDW